MNALVDNAVEIYYLIYYLNSLLGVIPLAWAAFLSFKASRPIDIDALNIIQIKREMENKSMGNFSSRWIAELMVIMQRELTRGSVSTLMVLLWGQHQPG